MREIRNAHIILVDESEEKKQLAETGVNARTT
jgi:hypothetical protein